jgi:hypothetical protein
MVRTICILYVRAGVEDVEINITTKNASIRHVSTVAVTVATRPYSRVSL